MFDGSGNDQLPRARRAPRAPRASPSCHARSVSCSICAQIPDVLTANIGRDHFLPETTAAVKPLGWGSSSSEDIWKCPQCDNLYTYYSEQAFTGSGNTDEDVLTRLTPDQARVVRT